jgi:hypothetical protein
MEKDDFNVSGAQCRVRQSTNKSTDLFITDLVIIISVLGKTLDNKRQLSKEALVQSLKVSC